MGFNFTDRIPKLLTFQRTMEELDLSRYKLNQYIDSGKIVPIYIDGKPYFRTDDITKKIAYIESLTAPFASSTKFIAELTQGLTDLNRKVDDLLGK